MRLTCRPLLFALLTLAAACGPSSNRARWNTTLDPTTHDSFFPIAAGSKHALGSDSPAITCNSCHGSADSFQQFDCLSCHQHADQAALTLGHRGVPQFAYASASCYSCHARGTTSGALPSGIVSDPARDLAVNALIPTYTGTSISSLSPQAETLPMPMDHATALVDAAALASCGNCHLAASSGSYYPGKLHSSLASLNLAQPSACLGCHASSKPIGFVGPTATNPARTPASGEMKHDAVLWSNGMQTAASAVPQDCAGCHLPPSPGAPGTWATSKTGTTPALFHSSLTAASLPQPASCLDCHANSRPGGVWPAGNVQFDHAASAALVDCASCHTGSTASLSWTGGKFHLPGGATPASCLPCHAGERPTTTSSWTSPTYAASPFDYVANPQGVTHGAGQDCAACHGGPGTGAWGGTQTWVGGHFQHGASTISGSTCIACHATQRPDLVLGAATASSLLNFDHSTSGTADCLGCHQATVTANRYQNYFNGSQSLPGGDWQGAQAYPTIVTLAGFASGTSITSNTVTFSHPSPSTFTSCAQCHAGTSYSTIIDFNHDGLTSNVTINGAVPSTTPNLGTSQYNASTNPTFCVACHDSSSPWVTNTGASSTIAADTSSGSTTVTGTSTSALTLEMIVTGPGIPNTTTTTTTFTATVNSGSITVTTIAPVSLSRGTVISGNAAIPAGDTVAASVNNATTFTLTTAATATAAGVTLTGTRTNPLTVTIKTIPSATSFTISTAANATASGTTLTVTHVGIRQASIGSHGGSTSGQDCTSCHYQGGGNQQLTAPTPGVFGTGSISGG